MSLPHSIVLKDEEVLGGAKTKTKTKPFHNGGGGGEGKSKRQEPTESSQWIEAEQLQQRNKVSDYNRKYKYLGAYTYMNK